jgi:hypothetical protein
MMSLAKSEINLSRGLVALGQLSTAGTHPPVQLICSAGKEVDFKLGMGINGIEHYDRLTRQGI